jgi:beta-galactosidase
MAGRFDHALARMGIAADAVGLEADWDRYRVLIAPCLHVLAPSTADRLQAFVRGGGTLILGPRSGVKDIENAVVDALLPGLLRELAGCKVEEVDAFSSIPGLEVRVSGEEGGTWSAQALAEVLVPEGSSRVLLRYADRFYAGRPAAVEHPYGQGRCIYLGTVLDDAGLHSLLQRVTREAGIPGLEGLPESVEVTRRVKGAQGYACYLNHGAAPVRIELARPGVDLLTGRQLEEICEIPGFDLIIVKEQPGQAS